MPFSAIASSSIFVTESSLNICFVPSKPFQHLPYPGSPLSATFLASSLLAVPGAVSHFYYGMRVNPVQTHTSVLTIV